MFASPSSRGPTPPPSSPRYGLPKPQKVPVSELTEALKNTGMSAPYNPLLQAVEATGRTRGSSATPSPQTAQLYLQSGINTSSVTGGNKYQAKPYDYSHYPIFDRSQQVPRNQSYGNQLDHSQHMPRNQFSGNQPKQAQQLLSSSNPRYPRGSVYGQPPSSNPQRISSIRSTLERHNTHLQQQLSTMSQRIAQQSGIPSQAVLSFRDQLRNISNSHQRNSVTCLAEFEKLATEHAELIGLASERQRLIDTVVMEKDRLKIEQDQMASIKRHLEEKTKAQERSYLQNIENLQKELTLKEEQIEGKRSLWVLTSSARRARESLSTTSREPITPSKTGLQPTNLMERSITFKLASDAPDTSLLGDGLAFRSQPTTKNPGNKIDSMALVPFKTEEQVADEFSGKFGNIYTMAEQWVLTHTDIVPNLNSSSDISVPYDSDLYKCILRTCYNTLEAAQVHVASLLKDVLGRPMLFLRVLVDYIRDRIWTSRAFMGLDEVCGEKLDSIEKRLALKGLTPEERAKLIDSQTQTINYILENNRYPAFRSAEMGRHSAALRKLLGPLLLKDGNRHSAARDLSQLVVVAFDLSADMLLANRTFFFQFPETGARFLHTSMICRDLTVKEEPLDLHLRHARVRLTIIPVITIRNDLYRTIEVHSIQQAHVLVMN